MDIEVLLKHKDIFQSAVAPFSIISFSADVLEACKANLCGQYGTCWTCPPALGGLDKTVNDLSRYNSVFVFTCLSEIKDYNDLEGIDSARKFAKGVLSDICERLDAEGVDYRPLGCGSCDVCAKCTYPDLPCRFPKKAIASVEACGINVVKLAQDTGICYYNGENTVTFFNLILF